MASTTRTRTIGHVRPSANFLVIVLVFLLLGICLDRNWIDDRAATFAWALAAWLLSLCLHEFGHAWVAWKGGDDTIPATGYLTLDPIHYADPMFSVIMPMVFLVLGGIGLPGGCVFIDRARLRSRIWQSAVSAAGPAMNALFLLALMAFYRLCSEEAAVLRMAIAAAAFVQCIAIVLNLLPIPGLDGYGILHPWLPAPIRAIGGEIAAHSGMILMGLFLFSGAFSQALSQAGVAMATTTGFERVDIWLGVRAMRLW